MPEQDLGKTSTGMQPTIEAPLAYLVGIVTGIIFYLIEKENEYVRFHAVQSIIFSAFWMMLNWVLVFIPVVGWALLPIMSLVGLVLWIILMVKAYQGIRFRLPYAADIADKACKKV